jgi:gamma-glutamylputrescine oxidase
MQEGQPHIGSWYAASTNRTLSFPRLEEDRDVDVCIIGGGYTGLSAAIHLRRQGYSVILLEANRVGWGASGRNGGHVGTGQRVDQPELEKLVGAERARALWDLGLEAVDTVCGLIDEFAIDCDLREGDLLVASSAPAGGELEGEVELLATTYGYEQLRYVPPSELPELTSAQGMHGGILDRGARHLHPLNYALGLAAAASDLGAELFEDSRVLDYREDTAVHVRTAGGTVNARYLVLGCNGYLDKLERRCAGRIMPINNFMLATEPLPEATARQLIREDWSMSDTRFVINYWKLSADNRLLFGGGETYTRSFPGDIKAFVRPYLLRIYPELEHVAIDYGWGGTLAITMSRLPDIGRLSARIFYAHGYSGHGVPTATFAGKILAEVIAGSAERFDIMAGMPSRRFPGGTALRFPGLVAGMLFYSLRDRLAR